MDTNPEESRERGSEPFVVRDCTLIAIATGRRAQNLRELGMQLATIPPACIYYHFWGGLLRPRFDDPEYQNDFASWARRALHDKRLAERLGIIDPTDFADLEDLRRELIEVIEARIEESEMVPWARPGDLFYFVHSQINVFDTGIRIHQPDELARLIPRLSPGSIFFHFIDARRRDPKGIDDLGAWLQGFGDRYGAVVERLGVLDPYFTSLTELREQIAAVFRASEEGATR
jgi:hypothetical protein